MALRDLVNDTTLKSLKYGFDQLGGGDSGQPYITTDISDPNLTNLNLARGGLGSILREAGISPIITINNKIGKDDGFVRGGFLGAANASIVDTVRVGSWIVNNPLWVAKQVGLQLSNPRLETPKNDILKTNPGNLLSFSTNGILQPTRIYNLGINTLLQVPTNAFGVHFYRHGLGPTMDDNQKYEAIARANNNINESSNENRLVSLKSKLNIGNPSLPTSPLLNNLTSLISRIPVIGSLINSVISDNTPIDDYLTGPGSVYGVGSTLIRRYQNTSIGAISGSLSNEVLLKGKAVWNNNTAITDNDLKPVVTRFFGVSNLVSESVPRLLSNYINKTLVNNENTAVNYNSVSPSLRKYGDLFKATQAVTNITQSIPFSDSKKYNAYDAYNSPFSKERRYFKTQDLATKAELNRDAPDFRYYGKRTAAPGSEGSIAKYGEGNKVFERYDSDILTIMFRGVDPFTLNEERWAFSAYLSGFRDDFNATWNDVNYIGRSETFYIYSKFRRSVSFSLKIPCFNRNQLFEKHRALGQLASTTAGRYNSNGTNTLGGMLLRLNVGNYLVGEYATMTSLQYSIPDDSSWDITPEARLAMYIEANFSFNIVHQKLPQYLPSATTGSNNNIDNNDAGFFGYLPNSVAGDAEFLKISGRKPNDQNSITEGFSIDLVKNDVPGKGTVLAKENPKPVVGNSSRYLIKTTT